MIIDQWNPIKRRYRTETFCYGPFLCRLPIRTGTQGSRPSWNELHGEDWIDDEATSHGGPDE